MASIGDMRDWLRKTYSGTKWVAYVDSMTDAQVIAVYRDFLRRGKIR